MGLPVIPVGDVTTNSNGVIVGPFLVDDAAHRIRRTAAHTYAATSARSDGDDEYLCYVEGLSPRVGRCACPRFIITGEACKHLEWAFAVERWVAKHDPDGYQAEADARRDRRGW